MDAARRGDELVAFLRSGDATAAAADAAKMELLSELFHGYPVTALAPLMRSEDPSVVKIAAWLVSEMGEHAAPVLDEVAVLLAHPERTARFFALDAVMTAASPVDGGLVAAAVALIDDEEGVVRRKAMRMLAVVSASVLLAGLEHLPPGRLRDLTAWSAEVAEGHGVLSRHLEMLRSPDPLERRFAAAAALRVAADDPRPVEEASQSDDPDVRVFASRERG